MKTSKDWLKTVVNGELAPRHVNLLIQKTTPDDDDDDDDDTVAYRFHWLCSKRYTG